MGVPAPRLADSSNRPYVPTGRLQPALWSNGPVAMGDIPPRRLFGLFREVLVMPEGLVS
jgi:hypothetical protein